MNDLLTSPKAILLLLCLMCLPKAYAQDREDRGINVGSPFQQTLFIDPALELLSLEQFGRTATDVSNYKLDNRDIISISVQGSYSVLLKGMFINAEGEVLLPVAGKIELRGLTPDEAEVKISEAFRKKIKDAKVEVTLEYGRSARITLAGASETTGILELPAFSRVSDLFTSSIYPDPANPNNTISAPIAVLDRDADVRNIEIERADGSTFIADLDAFGRTGRMEFNPILMDGDRIFVPKSAAFWPHLAISGSVQNPLRLNYKAGTTAALMLEMAGGFAFDADSNSTSILRQNNGNTEEIIIGKNLDVILQPNDIVNVPPDFNARKGDQVHIIGEVVRPGYYPIKTGVTTVEDVMAMAGMLTDNALENGVYIKRYSSDRRPVTQLGGGLERKMIRRGSDQTRQGLEYLSLEQSIDSDIVFAGNQNWKEITLLDGDEIRVPYDHQTVKVIGQVNKPGLYKFEPDMSIDSYIDAANGFALAADKDRIFVLKVNSGEWLRPNETSLESGDMIYVDRVPYEDFYLRRTYGIQRFQIILAGISAITAIVTTYVAVRSVR